MTPRLPDAVHSQYWQAVKEEISRFPRKDRIDMPGAQTPQGPCGTRSNAPYGFAFRIQYDVGTRKFNIHFVAQWLACPHPCQRFAAYLAIRNA